MNKKINKTNAIDVKKEARSNYLLVLVVFVIPLIFTYNNSETIISYRFIAISLSCILLSLYVYLNFKKIQITKWPSIFLYIFMLLIICFFWFLYTTLNAINPSAGYFDLIKFLIFGCFLFLSYLVFFNYPSTITLICKIFSFAAIIHSLIGIYQYFGIDFLDLPGISIPYGLMGNRVLYASAQMLLLPFVVFLFSLKYKIWNYIALCSSILLLVSIVIAQTRSAWLGTILFLLFAIILIFSVLPKNDRRKIIKWLLLTVSITTILVAIILSTNKSNLYGNITAKLDGENITNINDSAFVNTSGAVRLQMWEKSVLLIKHNIVKGVGIGNWRINVRDYGNDVHSWRTGTIAPDRPHNLYLLILSETGIVGALLYFGFWILILFVAIKSLKNKINDKNKLIILLMLCGLISYFVDSFFSFANERIEHNIYITIMAAIILSCYNVQNLFLNFKQNVSIRLTACIIFIVIGIFGITIGYKKYIFEHQLEYAKAMLKLDKNDDAINAVQLGKTDLVSINEAGIPIEMYSALAYDNQKMYKKAIDENNRALLYNPNSHLIYINKGVVYDKMKNYDSAIIFYKKSLQLAPFFEQALKNLAGSYYNTKQYDSCINIIKKMDYLKNDYLNSLMQSSTQLKTLKK